MAGKTCGKTIGNAGLLGFHGDLPSICYIAIENGPVEIVEFPTKTGDFKHSSVTVYQRVSINEPLSPLITINQPFLTIKPPENALKAIIFPFSFSIFPHISETSTEFCRRLHSFAASFRLALCSPRCMKHWIMSCGKAPRHQRCSSRHLNISNMSDSGKDHLKWKKSKKIWNDYEINYILYVIYMFIAVPWFSIDFPLIFRIKLFQTQAVAASSPATAAVRQRASNWCRPRRNSTWRA